MNFHFLCDVGLKLFWTGERPEYDDERQKPIYAHEFWNTDALVELAVEAQRGIGGSRELVMSLSLGKLRMHEQIKPVPMDMDDVTYVYDSGEEDNPPG